MRVYTIQPPNVVRQIHQYGQVSSLWHKAMVQQRGWRDLQGQYVFVYDTYAREKHYQFHYDQGLFWADTEFTDLEHGRHRTLAYKRASRFLLTLDVPDAELLSLNRTAWDIMLLQSNLLESNADKPLGTDWDLLFSPTVEAVMAADYRKHHSEESDASDGDLIGAEREVVFPQIKEEWIQHEKHFRGKQTPDF